VEAVRRMSQESGRETMPLSFDLDHHETLEELRSLPDAEIERRHDATMQSLKFRPLMTVSGPVYGLPAMYSSSRASAYPPSRLSRHS
jgi:hypothetical protein